MQEVLDGFDVSLVFDQQDSDYYTFKSDIDSKESIREYVNSDSQQVISQLERWWEKYKVSLSEIDKQVETAEAEMNGFLEELGYLSK